MIYSCLLAVACINFKADQTLVGTALNLLGTAGATVIVKAINTAGEPRRRFLHRAVCRCEEGVHRQSSARSSSAGSCS